MRLRHPKHSHAELLAKAPTPDLVIDVGASDGRWSESVMHFWPDARYTLVDSIEYQGKLTHPQWTWHHVIAGSGYGEVCFDVTEDLYGSGVYGTCETPNSTTRGNVALRHIIPTDAKNIFLKMDTHGFEVPILAGLAPHLSQVCGIQVELYARKLSPTCLDIRQMLNNLDTLGFRLVAMFDQMNRYGTKELWQVDGIFFRNDHPIFDVNSYR